MVTTTNPDYHVEIDFQQKRPKGEIACGDVFQSSIIREEGRTILVLSDGIGHGIKASVLATTNFDYGLKIFALAHQTRSSRSHNYGNAPQK